MIEFLRIYDNWIDIGGLILVNIFLLYLCIIVVRLSKRYKDKPCNSNVLHGWESF